MSLSDRIERSRQRADRMVDMSRASPVRIKANSNSPASIIGDSTFGFTNSPSSSGLQQYRSFCGHAYTAINAIARRVAGQDIFVASQSAGPRLTKSSTAIDGLEPILNHRLIQAINEPNPIMVRWSLMYSTVASLDITGEAYWWFLDGGDRYEIWPIPKHWVSPADPLRRVWKVRPFGQASPIDVDAGHIAFFNLPDPSDPFGSVSPLQTQAASINADDALQQSQLATFRNGIKPSVILKAGRMQMPGETGPGMRPILTQEQRAQLINAMQAAYRGVHRHGDPIIVDGMIEDVVPFSNKPAEMDFLSSGKLTRSRILAAYGINPLILGEIEGANRAQAVVAEESFCENVINPMLTLMSQVLTRWVGPLFSAENEKLTVWIDPCRARDPEQTLKEWSVAMTRGAVTPNEYRRHVLNLGDIDGGDELVAPQSLPPAVSPAVKRLAGELNPYSLRKTAGQR